jgi:4,5-dihydroxyphthalate decarboxylase
MPFVEDNLRLARQLMGDDFWTYGVAGNAKVLEAFCEMHFSQGLSPRKLAVDELFHPATYESYKL